MTRRDRFLLSASLLAQDPPPELTRPVNDFAGVIGPDAEQQLDDLIRRLQAASGDVIVVATVETFQPYGDITEYAVKMFENHGKGIGQKGKDNGVLVLVAVQGPEGAHRGGLRPRRHHHGRPCRRDQPRDDGAALSQRRLRRGAPVPASRGWPSASRSSATSRSTICRRSSPRRARRGRRFPPGFGIILFIVIINILRVDHRRRARAAAARALGQLGRSVRRRVRRLVVGRRRMELRQRRLWRWIRRLRRRPLGRRRRRSELVALQ